MSDREKLNELINLLNIHPEGTHYCFQLQQPGYALHGEYLLEICNGLIDAQSENEKLKRALDLAIRELKDLNKGKGCMLDAREALEEINKILGEK
jgi:hypothetical protein